jgi:hypothetical protein
MDIVAGGFQELKLASEVEDVMAKPGTTLNRIAKLVYAGIRKGCVWELRYEKGSIAFRNSEHLNS